MADYDILTDSSCDLSQEMAASLGVRVAPLVVNIGGKSYPGLPDDQLGKFYSDLRGGASASTSAVNIDGWMCAMRPTLEAGRDLVVIVFASALSATYQCAVNAGEGMMEEFPERRVYVLDSKCASMGQGLLVWYACRKRDAGASAAEVAQWVEENRLNLCHFFTVDDLGFLRRGGRISGATAALGSMMQIKPVLHVDDEGRLVNVSKVRGRKAAMQALVDKVVERGAGYDNSTIFISHGDCLADAQSVADMIRAKTDVREVVINYVGAVIGSHSGPGTLAVFFLGSKR